jgi:hypothetical protein
MRSDKDIYQEEKKKSLQSIHFITTGLEALVRLWPRFSTCRTLSSIKTSKITQSCMLKKDVQCSIVYDEEKFGAN